MDSFKRLHPNKSVQYSTRDETYVRLPENPSLCCMRIQVSEFLVIRVRNDKAGVK